MNRTAFLYCILILFVSIYTFEAKNIQDFLSKQIYLNGGMNLNELDIIQGTRCIWNYKPTICDKLKSLSAKIFDVCVNHIHLYECQKPINKLGEQGVFNTICTSKHFIQTEACKVRYASMVNKEIE